MDGILKFINEKDAIETKIKEFSEILSKNQNVGMDSSLVDDDGFPRSDIDIYQVRHARRNIICLQNDHKALMKRIQDGIEAIHDNSAKWHVDPNGTDASPSMAEMTAFAYVSSVEADSPADIDGLIENDNVCKFGSVNADNYTSLSAIGDIVKNCVNQPVHMIIRRCVGDNNIVEREVVVTPHPWSGRGLLGCKIVPMESAER